MKFSGTQTQFYCFAFAVIVYACFGSPTPDGLGIAEIVVALGLMLSCRIHLVGRDPQQQTALWVAMLYGLTIPTFTALLYGQQSGDILRDLIPFLFMFLPLFFGWLGYERRNEFIILIVSIGIIFSLRTIVSYHAILFQPELWGRVKPSDLLYLANSPEVLFSALYCIGQGGYYLVSDQNRLKAIPFLLISILPVIAMTLMAQRAGIGAVLLYIIIALLLLIYKRPKDGVLLFFVTLIMLSGLTSIVGIAFDTIIKKTEIVGLNARSEEWGAVFNVLSADVASIFLGEGWGGRLENPAVGGLNVNFTHSLVSALLLKSGVLGAVIILFGLFYPVLGTLYERKGQFYPREWLVIGAALFPLLISIFLYASYKSLGFGLILLVFFIISIRKLDKKDNSVS